MENNSFEKGHKLNYKIKATIEWESGKAVLYNCEGDKVWIANSIHYYEYEFNMEVNEMPWRDGTGPIGQGPLTGRGLGPCGLGLRKGRGFSRGFGRGFAWRSIPDTQNPYQVWEPVQVQSRPTKEQEIELLENEEKAIEIEEKALRNDLESVRKRLKELKG